MKDRFILNNVQRTVNSYVSHETNWQIWDTKLNSEIELEDVLIETVKNMNMKELQNEKN